MPTTFLVVKNDAISTLATGIDVAVTSLGVAAGEGAKFPSTYPFHITIDTEILSCTNLSTDTLTVVRAQQGTSAAAHSAGVAVATYRYGGGGSGARICYLLAASVCGATEAVTIGAAATIGVGDSATAAVATQTDLQAAVNKTYKAMEAGYPTSTIQKATFKSSFGSADANYAWQEWVVKQATSLVCLNRKVESLGTKSTGTWTLEVDITLS